MPEKAAQLYVWLRGFPPSEQAELGSHSKEEAEIKEALREFGFSVFEVWEPVDGRQINTYPFEEREENVQTMNKFVKYVEDNYAGCDVNLNDEGTLGHPGRDQPAQQFYMLTVDARSDTEEKSLQDDGKSEPDTANKESEKLNKDVEWRDKSEFTREQDVTEEDSSGFHPPCEHCGSTVFKQEITTTHYVECDTKGNFVNQDTEHERDEVIYCDECGRKLSERTKY